MTSKRTPARSRGRPPLLDDATQRELLRAIRLGVPVHVACDHAGIGRSTFYVWQARGDAAAELREQGQPVPVREQRYLDFVDALRKAVPAAEVTALARVVKAAEDPRHWQAAAWLLERRHPDRYARTVRTELSGAEGGPVQVEAQVASVEVKVDLRSDRERARAVLEALAGTGLLDAALEAGAQLEDTG
jgi:hypothetical protein